VVVVPKAPKAPNSAKYKARIGYEGEYYLIQRFLTSGERCYAVRTPGSGSGKMVKPDIIAVDDGELLAIEVKSSRKNYVMLNKDQLKRLTEFCRRFVVRCPECGKEIKPKPILAVRFLNKGWRFIEVPEDWDGPIIVKFYQSSLKRLEPSSSPAVDVHKKFSPKKRVQV